MKEHRNNLVIGILFIFIGLTWMLINMGLVSPEIWGWWLRFWPMLLILAGIKIFLGENRISGIIISVVTILFFGLILVSGLKYYNSPLVLDWGLGNIPLVDWFIILNSQL